MTTRADRRPASVTRTVVGLPSTDLATGPRPVGSLALPLLAVTQRAALACHDWVGRGDANGADAAAVAAMRGALAGLPGQARVVIGEGEKDQAPMLFAGEMLGAAKGPRCDLAVDPLEGTKLCAAGQSGAVSVVAAAPPGTLFATPGWYMEKLVVGAAAAGAVAINRSIEENLAGLAEALGKPVAGLRVAVQDRPRHEALVAALRRAGTKVVLFAHGDVMMSLRVLLPDGDLDALMGIGGAPEGVITACATRLLGGQIEGRLAPQSTAERQHVVAVGAPARAQLRLHDLVGDDDCVFAATGVTGGGLLDGPRQLPSGQWALSSLLAAPGHPWARIESAVPVTDADIS